MIFCIFWNTNLSCAIGEIGVLEPNIRQTADHPPSKSMSLWSHRTEAVLPVRRRSPSDQSPRPTVSMLCAKETVRRVLGEIGVLEPNIRQTADHPPSKSMSLWSRRTEAVLPVRQPPSDAKPPSDQSPRPTKSPVRPLACFARKRRSDGFLERSAFWSQISVRRLIIHRPNQRLYGAVGRKQYSPSDGAPRPTKSPVRPLACFARKRRSDGFLERSAVRSQISVRRLIIHRPNQRLYGAVGRKQYSPSDGGPRPTKRPTKAPVRPLACFARKRRSDGFLERSAFWSQISVRRLIIHRPNQCLYGAAGRNISIDQLFVCLKAGISKRKFNHIH